MKAVIQRVSQAEVRIDEELVGQCGYGMLIFLGASKKDAKADAEKLALKIASLRIFSDAEGKMNLALSDLPLQDEPQILVVSNFTLYGDVTKSRRPSFIEAAPYEKGKVLYENFLNDLRSRGLKVETGLYGADMQVELINDGPVTFVIESSGR